MGNKFLNDIPWLTKEKKEKFKKLKGSANSKVDLNKMRDELKYPDKEIKIMNKNEVIKITENITKDFSLVYGDVKLATLLKDNFEFDNDTYTLLFSHKEGVVNSDQLEYLKQKYLNDDEPIEYLDVRVPFNYKDVKYQSMDIKDYIAMVEEIERREELEVLEILKKRNIID